MLSTSTMHQLEIQPEETVSHTTLLDVNSKSIDIIGYVTLPCIYKKNQLYSIEWCVTECKLPYTILSGPGDIRFGNWRNRLLG